VLRSFAESAAATLPVTLPFDFEVSVQQAHWLLTPLGRRAVKAESLLFRAWLMEELHAIGGLFFVDSYTAVESVALQLAQEAGIPAVRRHVFLDAEISHEGVRFQFARLVAHAQEHGYAVGIGHPHTATLEVLAAWLPEARKRGFALVPISAIVGHQIEVAQGRPGSAG